MRIRVLGSGTSHGIPQLNCSCYVCSSADTHDKRYRSSIIIEHPNNINWVVDTGPDFRSQMLQQPHIHSLSALFFTHEHKDHTSGLDDVRAYSYNYEDGLNVYAQQRVCDNIKMCYGYIFTEKTYPGIPRLQLIPIQENTPIIVDGIEVTPIAVMHYKLPILGFRIGDFAYITDGKYITDQALALLQGLKVLILNALRIEPHLSHFNLEEAIEMATKIGAENSYFTHISHQLGLHSQVDLKLPKGMHLAFDGLTIDL
ncbi:MAG: MBL fold metallo-hydrolase [Bacteroidota bacterium]|nr:MBL fold metallo-hydrolase [Bacteroidota bacterium]